MRIEEQRRPRAGMSLTPVVDIVFLLLLFFMLASTFGRFAEVELGLAARGTTSPPAGGVAVVAVLADGRLQVDGVAVEADGITKALRRRLPDGGGQVIVRPSPEASAQDIVRALEQSAAADVGGIVMAR